VAADLPDGVELAHTHWGEPKSDTSIQAVFGNVAPSPFGVPYGGPPPEVDRGKKCKANGDTCNGWRVTDSEFCAGHAGILRPFPLEVKHEPPTDA
jgi:hypothetical protein